MSSIISGITQQFYHTVPSDLDMKTTAPTREGIFKYLSQIGYDKFPEFILDILIKVEGHKPVDVTDGQGDEKQDILTINQKGERCLTQCKHTVDYKSHYNGDDLDLMVAACMRKNCKQAIFVTNADLTPQGKKYVNDKEYCRGFSNPADCPDIEYWNGFKIWEKIKHNQDIINKWFSGLGQVHGLRTFKFDLTIQELPKVKKGADEEQAFDKLLALLVSKPWVKEIVKNLHYSLEISKDYVVHLKRWFQFTGALDINFLMPDEDLDFVNKPEYALTVEVVLDPKTEKYNPASIREEIIKRIGEELPGKQVNEQWWHFTASQNKGIIYLHDIAEPREIDLTSATTFVKAEPPVQTEFNYCFLSGSDFTLVSQDEDTIWKHNGTDVQVIQLYEQKINPVEQYNYQLMQYSELQKISGYNFYAVEKINSSMLMRVRRLFKNEWMAFQKGDDTLMWAVPPDVDADVVNLTHGKLKAVGLKVLKVKPEDVPGILNGIQKDLVPSNWMFTAEMSRISYPVLLDRRIFWMSKDLKVNKEIDVDLALELLKFKYAYEHEHGFDNMLGKTEQKLNSVEMRELLFDIYSFRGKSSIDIGIYNNPISINIRYSERRTESSKTLALEYVQKFMKTWNEIDKLLN